MIMDAIYNLFKNVALWIVCLLPESAISFGETGLGAYLVNANQFVNMPLLMSFVGVFITYEVTVLMGRLIYWVWITLKP